MNVENIDISSALYRAAEIVRSRYNLDDSILRITDSTDDLMVLGDESDLITVFINLLDNAVKYSGDDRKISVRVKKTALNNKVDIFIRDNGLGIPQAELKRIFKRFDLLW